MQSECKSLITITKLLTKLQITSLDQITDIEIAKTILISIDPNQIGNNPQQKFWGQAKSLNHLCEMIGKYYLIRMGANIADMLSRLNVYKQPLELWKLIMGIGLEGPENEKLVNIIVEQISGECQVEIHHLTSDFIENIRFLKQQTRDEHSSIQSAILRIQNNPQKQMITELAEENSQLREKYEKVKETYQLFKKQMSARRKEDEAELTHFRNQKMLFERELSEHQFLRGMRSLSPVDVLKDILDQLDNFYAENINLREKLVFLRQQTTELEKTLEEVMEENSQMGSARQNEILLSKEVEQLEKTIGKMYDQDSRSIKKIRQLQESKQQLKDNLATQIQTSVRNKTDQKNLPEGLNIETQVRSRKLSKQKSTTALQYEYKQPESKKNYMEIPIFQEPVNRSGIFQPHNMKNELQGTLGDDSKLRGEIELLKNQNRILREETRQLLETNLKFEEIVKKYKDDSLLLLEGYQDSCKKIIQGTSEQFDPQQRIYNRNAEILESYLKSYHQRQRDYLTKVTKLQLKVKKAKNKNEKLKKSKRQKNTKSPFGFRLGRTSFGHKQSIKQNNDFTINLNLNRGYSQLAVVQEEQTNRINVENIYTESVDSETDINEAFNFNSQEKPDQNLQEPELIEQQEDDHQEQHNFFRELERSRQDGVNIDSFNDLKGSVESKLMSDRVGTQISDQTALNNNKEQDCIYQIHINNDKCQEFCLKAEPYKPQDEDYSQDPPFQIDCLMVPGNHKPKNVSFLENGQGPSIYKAVQEELVEDWDIRSRRRSIPSALYQLTSQIQSDYSEENQKDSSDSSMDSSDPGEAYVIRKLNFGREIDREILGSAEDIEEYIRRRIKAIKEEANSQIIRVQKELEKITQQHVGINDIYSNLLADYAFRDANRSITDQQNYKIEIRNVPSNGRHPEEVIQILHAIINEKEGMLNELETLRNLSMEKQTLQSGKVKELLSILQNLKSQIQASDQYSNKVEYTIIENRIVENSNDLQKEPEESIQTDFLKENLFASEKHFQTSSAQTSEPETAKISDQQTDRTQQSNQQKPKRLQICPTNSIALKAESKYHIEPKKILQQPIQPKPASKMSLQCAFCKENESKLKIYYKENELLTMAAQQQAIRVAAMEEQISIITGAMAEFRQMAKARTFFK